MRIVDIETPPAGGYILSKADDVSAEFLPFKPESPVKFPTNITAKAGCHSGRFLLCGEASRGIPLIDLARKLPGLVDIRAVDSLYDGLWLWTMNDERSPLMMTHFETGDFFAVMPYIMPK